VPVRRNAGHFGGADIKSSKSSPSIPRRRTSKTWHEYSAPASAVFGGQDNAGWFLFNHNHTNKNYTPHTFLFSRCERWFCHERSKVTAIWFENFSPSCAAFKKLNSVSTAWSCHSRALNSLRHMVKLAELGARAGRNEWPSDLIGFLGLFFFCLYLWCCFTAILWVHQITRCRMCWGKRRFLETGDRQPRPQTTII